MQDVSKEYKESIKKPIRNRAYIRATIGIINKDAQKNAKALPKENNFAYFSDNEKPFQWYSVSKIYATQEEDFSKVDGSCYFLPEKESGMQYYNNGIVTNELLGAVYVSFGNLPEEDIKGLTIDFGYYYPELFDIEWDNGKTEYRNQSNLFITEDVFDGVTFIKITPKKMIGGQGRLRIFGINFGIAKTFTNENVLKYSLKDYVSPISDTLPSQDMTLEVDNQDLYYSVDNPESAFAFLEEGQEVQAMFGYDVTGNEDIEWLQPNTCFLKTWKADDLKARFTAVDRFEYMTGTYYRGDYRKDGVSLYQLAVDVLEDAGITDTREYILDPYLKSVIIKNPMPPVPHTEALQIIANAGRCVLYQDRQKRIHIKSSFVPEMKAETNSQTRYSNVGNVLKLNEKEAYAICSQDFSKVDGSLFFMASTDYRETGYISGNISNSDGNFSINPKITIAIERPFVLYGMSIKFRNVAPAQFKITTYLQESEVYSVKIRNTDLNFAINETFSEFDKMEIEFIKGSPNSRITVDEILLNDIVDYTFDRGADITGNLTGERYPKIKSIGIERSVYRESEEEKELAQEEITLTQSVTEHVLYLQNPSYSHSVLIENGGTSVVATITEQSCYMVKIQFSKGAAGVDQTVNFKVLGREYKVDKFQYTKEYSKNGEEKKWNNPLICEENHAADMVEWLATHFHGDVGYTIPCRGEPRMDAGDLAFLELKNREMPLIKVYENTLNYNGAWSATVKARKAVIEWQRHGYLQR